ncbi:MAG: hypothetical protein COX62_07250 [Deltaproteobacteria bacterium CG_4_10_14_0_2_um_filter_43_8]|nr:MAG: hypothetical protein COV43_08890 [Deltaproteobacteria bacterium CG11_big_fil_rev_8_21_14_0_20_42_23]PJA19096.1 MAG: hypothetical protein COX62_07250 [Deltaproteobacteria bacterium CG_4_10_14_0_2_um_filter_43_8]PJC64934.1 MAG: hypothetical protein CO021_01775 [Deltaproteobacteria bacterium CG_4_9_14_0_2_um_filter_42_21]
MIKFGTDGWRAVVGEDFTEENVGKVIQAFCDLYPSLPNTGKQVVIGYDRRNQSPESAELCARILIANNIPVLYASTFCPTPGVSWYTNHKKCTAGIMITASHNPPKWNGIKFKEHTGGAASGEFVTPVEHQIQKNDAASKKAKCISKEDFKTHLEEQKLVTVFDPQEEYLSSMKTLVDIEKIKQQKYKVLVEPMYGAGIGFFSSLLGNAVTELHSERDLTFGGINPEPIPPHVNEAIETMKKGGYDYCAILDGDADRAGAVDEHGSFITTHEIYSLLFLHAVKNKKWPGQKVIKSISTTQMVDTIGKHFGIEVETVAVGFKHISPAMTQAGVLMGGEESGGFGFPQHIPERDGILSNLLLLEMMAVEQKSISQLVADLQAEFGPTKYRRIDYSLSKEQIADARKKFDGLNIQNCAGKKLKKHTTIDGHHFLFEDNSWLLFRASGTEPLIRTYAEAATEEQVETMLAYAKEALGL